MQGYVVEESAGRFGRSRVCFERLVSWLDGPQAAGMSHAELESRLLVEARELTRRLQQDHLDLRALREKRLPEVADAGQVVHRWADPGRQRGLATVFGHVTVDRIAYRERGHSDLHPADAVLNLPAEKHWHGLRRLAAEQAARGSFGQAAATIAKITGVELGNRQVEQLAARVVVDFDAFYASRRPPRATAPEPRCLPLSVPLPRMSMNRMRGRCCPHGFPGVRQLVRRPWWLRRVICWPGLPRSRIPAACSGWIIRCRRCWRCALVRW